LSIIWNGVSRMRINCDIDKIATKSCGAKLKRTNYETRKGVDAGEKTI
jgi:hypothetical protein